jgi:imidazolonepropionase-like amidohydrolase
MKKILQRDMPVKALRDIIFDKKLSILAGWLIDGSGAPIQRKVRLDLDNGSIQSVRKIPAHDPDSKKANRSDLDLSGFTILPGLFDCHVHLAMTATVCRTPNATAKDRIRKCTIRHLNQYLATGVMAVRDGGDPDRSALHYKTSGRAHEHPIHVSVAATAWYRAGRYGGLIGSVLPLEQSLEAAVLEEKEGADHIKIVNSGLNSLTCYGKETGPQFNSAELKAAVNAARKRGFKTMVHANGKIPVKFAVDAGCDSIEHGFFMGEENLSRMAGRGTFWVPTAHTMQALRDRMKRKAEHLTVVQKNLEHQLEQIQIADELGVRIALGTDAGSVGVEHGQAVIEEMRLFLNAGYSIEKVIQSASHNGALLLDLPRVGQLKKNMDATFIAVKGDPSQLPESLNQIKIIINKRQYINLSSCNL